MASRKGGPSATVEIVKDHSDVMNGRKDEKKLTTYKVCVSHGSKSWFVLRKFKEFAVLHDQLKGQYPGVQFKFPPKKGLLQKNDQKFQDKRRELLDLFVQQLLSDSRIVQNKTVRDFFYIDSRGTDETREVDLENSVADDSEVSNEEERVFLGTSERKNARPSDFDYVKTIGKGSFGKVFLAIHKRERKVYAVKVLAKAHIRKRNEVRHIMSERNVLVTNIKHPFLVGLHYSFQTRDKLYFVLDYLNGGELFFHLQREKRFPEARARFYAAEIGSALGYLHDKNIIYRDLKPENLLLDAQGHVVITDFGLCKEGMRDRQTTSTFCGTPEYLAPEVVLRQAYDKTVDWWCLGSVLFEMLFGLPPFYSRDHKEMYDRIVNQPLKISNIVSPQARDVLTGMLQKERHKRLGAKNDFKDLQEHPFFAPIDWRLLLERKLTAPYVPKLADEKDTAYVDSDFLNEPVSESVARSPTAMSASVRAADHDFQGFTYVPRAMLDGIAE